MAKSRGLGRGLAALVAEFPAGQISMVEIELSQVRPSPRQPRRNFDDESIAQLAESIKSDGIVQPIVVRDAGDGYEIVAGERRWRAAKLAALRTIPAIVRQVDERESLVLALAENVAREDLNAVEEARAYAALADELGLSQTDIAKRVGKSRPAVANTVRLLDLPDAVLDLIASGQLSEGHGRAILQVEGQDERVALARLAAKKGLSVRETEASARKATAPSAKAKPRREPGWFDDELANLAVDAAWQSMHLKAQVKTASDGGAVEIRFETPAELGRIIDQLRAERVSWAD